MNVTMPKRDIPPHLLKYFTPSGHKPGDLVNTPHLVAEALRVDGWVLRQDVIWHKPAPMPESVRNRCTKAHEYVFLLTKGPRYFYDAEAVKERGEMKPQRRSHGATSRDISFPEEGYNSGDRGARNEPDVDGDGRRNKRSVWTVSSQGYEGAHFATFPPKLIEPMILAGTSARGACAKCEAPWRRDRPNEYVKRTGEDGTGNSCGNGVAGVDVKTAGWYPTCRCDGLPELPKEPAVGKTYRTNLGPMTDGAHNRDKDNDAARLNGTATNDEYERWLDEVSRLCAAAVGIATVPCTVCDPFVGSGTTVAVSTGFGRRGWGIDLSEVYLRENAVPRVEGSLLSRPNTRGLVKRAGTGPVVVGRIVKRS